jgi:polar amino acid transport system substrate-binding protein
VTAHAKVHLDADDILLAERDFGPLLSSRPEEEPVRGKQEYVADSTHAEKEVGATSSRNGRTVNLTLLVHELAHELKNPMVTIKTFSQLLGDRYDDPVFRNRFREMVSGDIERMDELLENLLDFSRMGQPVRKAISLLEQLRLALEDVLPESKRAWVNKEFMNMHEDSEVLIDPEHLRYALKGVVRTALLEAKPKGEVDIHTEKGGILVISYAQEGGRVVSLAECLDPNARPTDVDGEGMSLRVILAKMLLEQNGGIVKLESDDMGRVRVRLELPVVESGMRDI